MIRIHSKNNNLSNRIQRKCHFVSVIFYCVFESGNFSVTCKGSVSHMSSRHFQSNRGCFWVFEWKDGAHEADEEAWRQASCHGILARPTCLKSWVSLRWYNTLQYHIISGVYCVNANFLWQAKSLVSDETVQCFEVLICFDDNML